MRTSNDLTKILHTFLYIEIPLHWQMRSYPLTKLSVLDLLRRDDIKGSGTIS